MTGPSDDCRAMVLGRAGFGCEYCGGPLNPCSIHHRRPRQMGSTKADWINRPENLLALCGSGTTGCHGYFESHRTEGYSIGVLLRQGLWPWETPYRDRLGRWWLLSGETRIPITLP